ncbi:protein kinase domain-containing protein [Luteimonas sp. e5]
MDRSRWQRLSAELDVLIELDPAAREAHLATLQAEDANFVSDLRELLAQQASTDSLLDSPLVTAPPGPREGEEVGPYRLIKLLGEGGMGQVWLAERSDGLYQRRVALKLLRPGLADPGLRLRFTREREILARLAHPHIARLLDAGIGANGQPYLALEEVEGEGILHYCRSRGLGLRPRLELFRQVCEAVSHAHANLVVHRDLKPSNILVNAEGEVRLLDFGIAKLLDGDAADPPEVTRTGVRSFTLHYAAPEQIRGEPVGTRSDVYSLGVVLYELLAGQKPYRLKQPTSAQWEQAILAEEPLRPSQAVARGGDDEVVPGIDRRRWARMLSGDLDNIIGKALSKEPEQRYPSVEALSLDIQRHLDGLPVLARPQSLGYRLRKFARRHAFAITATAVVVLTLLGMLAFTWQQRQQAVREAARAQALQTFVIGLFENAGVARSGAPLEVETLIDAGELRGERELAQQPRAHAELLGVIARIRIALGQYAEAGELLDQQATILARMPDAPPGLRLEAATQRGRLQRLQGNVRECITLLEPALGAARRAQAQLPALSAEFYSQLARCRRANGESAAARPLFEQSLALRRSALGDDIGVVENLTDLAALSVDVGDSAQALRGFQGALAQLQRIAGPRHPLAIDILRSIGASELQMGRSRAASLSYAQALALSDELQGSSHPGTLALRRQTAMLYLDEGRIDDAAAEFSRNHPLLLQRHGATSMEAAASWDALAQVAAEQGEHERAHADFLRAARLLRDLNAHAALADTLQRDAAVLIEAGNAEAALRVLDEIDHLRPRNALGWRLRAEAWLRLGQSARALAAVEDGGNSAELELLRARLRLVIAAARQGRDAGDGVDEEASRAAIAADLARLQAAVADSPLDAAGIERHLQARLWLAEAHCHDPAQAGTAMGEFAALEATLESLRPQGGRLSREVQRAHEACRARQPESDPMQASS